MGKTQDPSSDEETVDSEVKNLDKIKPGKTNKD